MVKLKPSMLKVALRHFLNPCFLDVGSVIVALGVHSSALCQWMSVGSKTLFPRRGLNPDAVPPCVAVTLAVFLVPLEAGGAAELSPVVFRRNAGFLLLPSLHPLRPL